MSITAKQVKAARGLLGWSVMKLAVKSTVRKLVIDGFERGTRAPHSTTAGGSLTGVSYNAKSAESSTFATDTRKKRRPDSYWTAERNPSAKYPPSRWPRLQRILLGSLLRKRTNSISARGRGRYTLISGAGNGYFERARRLLANLHRA